jgi:riboflavin kinase/FMN adenylyltransferase
MNQSHKPARIASLDALPDGWRGGVVAIGNFDGVHRGHQAVLAAARAEAESRGVACLMLTFEPHPRAFFSGRPLFRLTPLPLKAAAAHAIGVDGTLVLDFDGALAGWSAENFVKGVLVERLRIQAAVTGHDFHFGQGRRGTPEFLREQGVLQGFSVTVVQAFQEGPAAVSSTRIRAALTGGDLATTNALLGWSWSVSGLVIHGQARGRELGYPTANMALDPSVDLALGIYAVRYLRPDGSLHAGVASFGRRPTFDHGEPLLETHLFDFDGDLYGETSLVSFRGFIRPELKFHTVQELIAQMDRDSLEARAILGEAEPGFMDRALRAAWLGLAEASRAWPS